MCFGLARLLCSPNEDAHCVKHELPEPRAGDLRLRHSWRFPTAPRAPLETLLEFSFCVHHLAPGLPGLLVQNSCTGQHARDVPLLPVLILNHQCRQHTSTTCPNNLSPTQKVPPKVFLRNTYPRDLINAGTYVPTTDQNAELNLYIQVASTNQLVNNTMP